MDLQQIRREYNKSGINDGDLADNPFEQFDAWLDQALKADLFADPTAMTVATVSETGMPSQRTVLLKGVEEGGFVFFTNYGSRKAQDIAQNPNVCLQFSWLPLERQVIIYGQAEKFTHEKSAAYFSSRPVGSQIAAMASHQSQTIASREALDAAFDVMKQITTKKK